MVGCIGELVFELFLKRNGVRFQDKREQTDHDYLVNEKVTVGVKTKERIVVPMAHYDNSVPLYNHGHQRTNYYYFVSLLADREVEKDKLARFKTAYLLGGIDLGALDRNGVHWKASQTDPRKGTTFWTACVNFEMEQLISNTDLLRLWKYLAKY